METVPQLGYDSVVEQKPEKVRNEQRKSDIYGASRRKSAVKWENGRSRGSAGTGRHPVC
jgi:hypothetical protein